MKIKNELSKVGIFFSNIAEKTSQNVKVMAIDLALAEMRAASIIRGKLRNLNWGVDMNKELKVIVVIVFTLIKVGKDLAQKKSFFSLLDEIRDIGIGVMSLLDHKEDLKAELVAIRAPENQADLIKEAEAKFEAVVTPDPAAKSVLTKGMELVGAVGTKALEFKDAVVQLKAVQTPSEPVNPAPLPPPVPAAT